MDTGKRLKALICGHTGATGKALLDALVSSAHYESIVAVGRRENVARKNSPKLTQMVVPDMTKVASIDAHIIGGIDVAFCCIGAGYEAMFKHDAKLFHTVDFEIATGFAEMVRFWGGEFFAVITNPHIQQI